MGNLKLIVFILSITIAILIAAIIIICKNYEFKITSELQSQDINTIDIIPQDFNSIDVVIALSHTSSQDTYVFVLSQDQLLEVYFGARYYGEKGWIESVNFMTKIEMCRSDILSKDAYKNILTLSKEIDKARATDLKQSFDGWNLTIITSLSIYESNYQFGHSDERQSELVNMLIEFSSMNIHLGWTGGITDK